MSFEGAKINKLDGGLGGGESAGRVAVLVIGCGAIENTLAVNQKYELLQIGDAEALGITEAHDDAASRLDYYHLSEVFRLSPETRINLIAVPATTKVSDLKNLDAFVAALRSIPNINTIAVCGLASESSIDISGAITGAQILVDNLAADHIYIDCVLLEGVGSYLPAASAAVSTYPNLRELDCPNISVIVGQDPAITEKKAAYASHAAVGSALGMLMVRAIHENLGSVDIEVKPRVRKAEQNYTLSDVKTGRWLSAALSNGRSFDALSFSDQKKLDENAFIYAGGFSGYGGYFFSNSHTCTEEASDYCFIERNAIWNKGARIIRDTLISRIRSKVQSDPATGYIKHTTITDWDGRVRKALEEGMKASNNIAEFDIFINPNQAAVSTNPFNVKVHLVADGIVHEFEVDLGFTKSI